MRPRRRWPSRRHPPSRSPPPPAWCRGTWSPSTGPASPPTRCSPSCSAALAPARRSCNLSNIRYVNADGLARSRWPFTPPILRTQGSDRDLRTRWASARSVAAPCPTARWRRHRRRSSSTRPSRRPAARPHRHPDDGPARPPDRDRRRRPASRPKPGGGGRMPRSADVEPTNCNLRRRRLHRHRDRRLVPAHLRGPAAAPHRRGKRRTAPTPAPRDRRRRERPDRRRGGQHPVRRQRAAAPAADGTVTPTTDLLDGDTGRRRPGPGSTQARWCSPPGARAARGRARSLCGLGDGVIEADETGLHHRPRRRPPALQGPTRSTAPTPTPA